MTPSVRKFALTVHLTCSVGWIGAVVAYLALGVANYIIGCLPAYKRAVLWVGGVHGDKVLGMQQVSRAAGSENARYLRPFARLMLALAALREKNPDLARQQLQELATEFPENPLFAKELAKFKQSRGAVQFPRTER